MRRLKRMGQVGVGMAASCFLLQLVVAATGVPGFVYRWFTGQDLVSAHVPAYIVVLGGGGIPSESGLIRTYYAAQTAMVYTGAMVVVSLPADGALEESSVGRMRDELVMRGVSRGAILMEHEALNTHEQAVKIRAMLPAEAREKPLMIVTSPTHMRRALLAFRKAGFRKLAGLPAVGIGAEADPGPGAALRYRFWANLEFQVRALRELCALAYYGARGWI